MADQYSLMELLKNDFNFESLAESKKQIKQSKQILTSNAADYNSQHSDEIDAGTRKRQLMLEAAGLDDANPEDQESFFKNSDEFMPTVQTPILNYLFFLTRDYKDIMPELTKLREEYVDMYGYLEHDYSPTHNTTAQSSTLTDEIFNKTKEQHNNQFGHLTDDYELGSNDGQKTNVPHMEDYIYKNMDSKTFQKLKKLKAKSKSDNEHEAFQAYKLCMSICKENNLDFDKIPNLYE